MTHQRATLTTRAVLLGWALAAFEAGLVLSSIAHFATTPWFLIMAVVAPMMIYGWGCWLVSKTPVASKLPWDLLALIGFVVLTHLRRQIYLGTNGWWMVAVGAVVALSLWVFLIDEKRGLGRKLLGSGLILHIILRLRQFSFNDPKMMEDRGWLDLFGFGFNISTDWVWALLGLVFLYAWWKLKPLNIGKLENLTLRVNKSFLAVPVFSLLYLHFDLQEGAVIGEQTSNQVAPQDAPNVVLVSWDTVRADSLPLFGGGGVETPNLDALAADGVLFDNYHTVAPITAPAHNSMLTGMLPPAHGLRANGDIAGQLATPRISEIFQTAGWETSAFISVQPVIGRLKGFPQGFDVFDDRQARTTMSPVIHALGYLKRTVAIGDRLLPHGLDFAAATTPGAITTNRAIEWINGRSGPFFTWVHLFDAHDPRDLDGEYEVFAKDAWAKKEAGPHAVNPDCEQSLVEQRGEISFMDFQLGRLLAALREKDPELNNTIIALVADHGECFGEGADAPELFGEGGIKVLHVPSLYEATQHVVGVIKPTSKTKIPKGLRSSADSAHIDLLPTMVELAGLKSPDGIQGRSLLPAMQGEEMQTRPLYMEAYGATNGDDRLVGWLDGDWKYVATIDGRFEFLFNAEFGDSKNLAAKYPEKLSEIREAFQEFQANMIVVDRGKTETTAAEQAALNDLGYMDTDDEE